MSDNIITVQDFPVVVNITETPINIIAAQAGVQGPAGIPGTGGGGGSSSSGVLFLNGLLGTINLTGLGSDTVTLNGQTIQISGNTNGFITTGNVDLRYYSITNPQSYIKSGEIIGIYYPITNPSGYITGFNSGLYVLNSQTGAYTGLFLTRLETGQFNTGNLIGYATVINLQSTGQTNYNYLIGLSGNLNSTGSNLQNQINSITNGTGNFYLKSNPQNYATTGTITSWSGELKNNVNWSNHQLLVTGTLEVDWGNGVLYYSNNNPSIQWQDGMINDANGTLTIDYINRLIYDSSSVISIDYQNRILSGNWTKNSSTILTSIDSGNILSRVSSGGLNVSGNIIASGFTVNSVINGGSTFNLGSNSFYVHTGSSVDTWILPTASSSPGKFYFIKNRGTGVILTGNSSTERIFAATSALTLTLNSGDAYIISSDSTIWNAM